MEQAKTILDSLHFLLVFLALVLFVGFGPSCFLLTNRWRRYFFLVVPLLGWCLLVLYLACVNLLLGVQQGIYPALALALVLNVIALSKGSYRVVDWGEAFFPSLIALALAAVALAPQVAQGSLGFMMTNQDEEQYYPVASYLLWYPSTSTTHVLAETVGQWRMWGWGFQYTMGAISAVTGAPTFETYMPTSYFILGLSVLAWYLLFRETFGFSREKSLLVVVFYSLLGLPPWFASYGYGTQMTSLLAVPLGAAFFAKAVKDGGFRMIATAGIAIAAGLVSFYRGIGLQYVFLFVPMGLVAVMQHRSLAPVGRALAIAGIAVLAGLPCNWYAWQFYVGQRAILSLQQMDITGGWNMEYFQPPSVMLGLASFPIAHDEEETGPLASLDAGLSILEAPLTLVVLAGAALGLVRSARSRPMLSAVVAGTAMSLSLNRFLLDYPYGYVKLMPVAAPLAYGLMVNLFGDLRATTGNAWGKWSPRFAPVGMFAVLSTVAVVLAYHSYDAVWSNATGWGQSIPDEIPVRLHQLEQKMPTGSKVFVAGHFGYDVPEDRIRIRQHMLGMRSESEQQARWGQRVRAIALTELLPMDTYAWIGDGLIFSHLRRLLDDEAYDYYLLSPQNDPRLEGLDRADIVWSDADLSLYRAKDVVRKSPWLIENERGSLAITKDRPLALSVSSSEISSVGAGLREAPPSKGRLRIGILAFGRSMVTITAQSFSRKLIIEEGLTWYTTPEMELPSPITVCSENSIGVVSLRVRGEGPEERDFIPRGTLGYYLYASSTLLNIEEWLENPFERGKPGSP